MAHIDVYAQDPQRALVDAVSHPVFKNFIDQSDIELVTVDQGDGTQGQEQALKRSSAKRVVQRVIDAAKLAKVDLKNWICSPSEFNLCGRLNTSAGDLMKQLNDFLTSKWTQATTAALAVFAAFAQLVAAAVLGQFLAILAAIGAANNVLVELCDCSVGA